jgi:hypothetical protein
VRWDVAPLACVWPGEVKRRTAGDGTSRRTPEDPRLAVLTESKGHTTTARVTSKPRTLRPAGPGATYYVGRYPIGEDEPGGMDDGSGGGSDAPLEPPAARRRRERAPVRQPRVEPTAPAVAPEPEAPAPPPLVVPEPDAPVPPPPAPIEVEALRARRTGPTTRFPIYENGVAIGCIVVNRAGRSLDVHCYRHKGGPLPCSVNRTYNRSDATTPRGLARGRPLGFLIAWLRAGLLVEAGSEHRDAHFQGKAADAEFAFLADGLGPERQFGRAYAIAHLPKDLEGRKRGGEPDEPEGLP